jgi:hypothetical protein
VRASAFISCSSTRYKAAVRIVEPRTAHGKPARGSAGTEAQIAGTTAAVGAGVDQPARRPSSTEADLHIGRSAIAKPPFPDLLYPPADVLRQGRAIRGIAAAEADHSHARSVHSRVHTIFRKAA